LQVAHSGTLPATAMAHDGLPGRGGWMLVLLNVEIVVYFPNKLKNKKVKFFVSLAIPIWPNLYFRPNVGPLR
jgi:hypothetical protein